MRFMKGPQQRRLTGRTKSSWLHPWCREHRMAPLLVGSHCSFLGITLVRRLKASIRWVYIPSCLFLGKCGMEKKKVFLPRYIFPTASEGPSALRAMWDYVDRFLSRFTRQIKQGDGKTQYQYRETKPYIAASQKGLSCSLFHQWDSDLRFPAACKLSMSTFHFFIDMKRWVATVFCGSRECTWCTSQKTRCIWERTCHAFPCAELGGGPAKRGCGRVASAVSRVCGEERFPSSPAVNCSLVFCQACSDFESDVGKIWLNGSRFLIWQMGEGGAMGWILARGEHTIRARASYVSETEKWPKFNI